MRTPFICILTAAALSAHAAEQLPGAFDYASQVGLAEINVAAYGCLAIANNTLQEGEHVTLIDTAAPHRVIESAIRKKLTSSCSRNTHAPPGTTFYSLRIGTEPMMPSIAVVRYRGDVREIFDTVRADLNEDGVPESFSSCTSAEGIHLSAWSREPLSSQRVWHGYYHLNHDVTPDCTPQESGE